MNSPINYTSDQNAITLKNMFKFLLRWGFPYFSPENYMVLDIEDWRVVNDVLFFIMTALMTNILKGYLLFLFVILIKYNRYYD